MTEFNVEWAPFEVDEAEEEPEPQIRSSMKSRSDAAQGHLAALGAPELWRRSRGEGIRIALLDSGVVGGPGLLGEDTLFLDHQGNHVGPGDRGGHGTACASLIASRDKRAPGVAPAATIVSIRVVNLEGKPQADRVVAGLATAIELDCDIVSCSFVFQRAPRELLDGMRDAVGRGMVVVGASGNEASVANEFPERTPDVIIVGALGVGGRPLPKQRLGDFTDVFAPGERLTHIDASGRVSTRFGHTSGAAALTSGVVALLLSACPGAERRDMARQIEGMIRRKARPVKAPSGVDAGLIDGPAVLQAL